MGGIGSGRYYWDTKSTIEDYLALDIRKWHRKKLLTPCNEITSRWYRNGEQTDSIRIFVAINKVILSYSNRECDGNWKSYSYSVQVDWSDCSYGGKRPWFLCPGLGCKRRVAILYGGAVFACRHCYKLSYKCQSESPGNRATRRADKIRDKLNWEPGILNGDGLKPKGMHWNTFDRLTNQHNFFVQMSFADAIARFGVNISELW